ncbi:MAG: VWA domain-containing protein [Thermodesulfobacteriota bacterium]|nr:VWA domain-containing protein [Thermodesulfobacteriota bacterium]
MKKKRILNNPKGAVAVIFVLLLVVLIGFTALGFDAGRWYAAKAKAQEACDAAVLAGMQAYGITNWKPLAEDVARENFPQGYLGFHRDTDGIAIVDKSSAGMPKIGGTIRASAETFFGNFVGINTADVCVSCAAGRTPLEIMLVLDRSYSMKSSLSNLKNAAKSFVNHFVETQEVDRMGLIIFSTGVQVPLDLQNNFVSGMIGAINGLELGTEGDHDTNMEDALDQADDDQKRNGDSATTFTKYAEDVPKSQRATQFLIFFTDGRPDAFRCPFTRNGITYDAVIPSPNNPTTWREFGLKGNTEGLTDVCPGLDGNPHLADGNEVCNRGWLHDPFTGEHKVKNHIDIDPNTGERVFYLDVNGTSVYFGPTGDGLPKDGLPEDELTQCKWDCSDTNEPNNSVYHVTGEPVYRLRYKNTRWHVFDPLWNDEYGEYEDDYSIDAYCSSGWCFGGLPSNCCDSPYCNINVDNSFLKASYVVDQDDPSLGVAGKMTLYHARKLKEEGIIIYCIGLGTVNSGFLKNIADTDDQYKECPDDGDLTMTFNEIADAIKKQVHLL